MKYTQVYDQEWFRPTPQSGHKMRCCDCALIHVMDFRVRDGKVEIRARRDKRATAITAVLDCTNDTAEAFGGRHRGECRVELADGRRATAPRPVAVGDYYFDQVWVPDVPR